MEGDLVFELLSAGLDIDIQTGAQIGATPRRRSLLGTLNQPRPDETIGRELWIVVQRRGDLSASAVLDSGAAQTNSIAGSRTSSR